MFQVPQVKNIYAYAKPINMGWGEKKLTAICLEEIGIDPQTGAVFLFHNTKKDQLKLFFLDATGSQEIQKILPQGGFMLPVAQEGENFIKIERKKLDSLFRR
jgi:hypothetical protein